MCQLEPPSQPPLGPSLALIVRALYVPDPVGPEQLLVDGRVDEPRVRVPVHQGVDLQLGLVKGVLVGRHHVAVDNLPYPGVQAHL